MGEEEREMGGRYTNNMNVAGQSLGKPRGKENEETVGQFAGPPPPH